MTVKEVREVVNAYKSDGKGTEEWEDVEEPEETEETEETEEHETFKRIVIQFFDEHCGLPRRTISANSTNELMKLLEELKKVEIK